MSVFHTTKTALTDYTHQRTPEHDLRLGADDLDVRRLNLHQSFSPTMPVRKKEVSQNDRHLSALNSPWKRKRFPITFNFFRNAEPCIDWGMRGPLTQSSGQAPPAWVPASARLRCDALHCTIVHLGMFCRCFLQISSNSARLDECANL